ncbi:hypothetical protein [Halorubrum sp. CSM-61]|uniref:hypothetical protein n=1 Tax=Halorubrum sp. CSM-61 TaxID=2485838 RepID=UPI000F4BB300|nr:hypothetical protein [Halorubrum sp. CSM-61]
MTDPEEVVTSIFILAVAAVVVVSIYRISIGGDVTTVSSIVGQFATPFVVLLLVIYGTLIISENV